MTKEHHHACPACGECISGTESDTRAHLAAQIGGTVDPDEWRIICRCGQAMTVQWDDGGEWRDVEPVDMTPKYTEFVPARIDYADAGEADDFTEDARLLQEAFLRGDGIGAGDIIEGVTARATYDVDPLMTET